MIQLELTYSQPEVTSAVADLPAYDQAIELACPVCGRRVICLFLNRDQFGFFAVDGSGSRHGCKTFKRPAELGGEIGS